MAFSMLIRFTRVQNSMNFSNANAVCTTLTGTQRLNDVSKSYTTTINVDDNKVEDNLGLSRTPPRRMSKAMRAYMARIREKEELMKREIAEYQIGVRHLANMMGKDPEVMTQKTVNKSIRYLFPSGLFERQAVPRMDHPSRVYPDAIQQKFEETGRPLHSMFYTGKPHFYEALHNITLHSITLNAKEDSMRAEGRAITEKDQIDLKGTEWLPKTKISKIIPDSFSDKEYEYLISCIERLCNHPMSAHASDFIMKFRKQLNQQISIDKIPELRDGEDGRKYVIVPGCMRKSARGQVIIRDMGTGRITINGSDITYFEDVQCREQIIFPLMFTGMADKVDVEATVHGGGPTGQSGAIRWGIAHGLRSFVDENMIEKMRLAGLLTRDWRRRERKKFGQEGARRKFTWKKR